MKLSRAVLALMVLQVFAVASCKVEPTEPGVKESTGVVTSPARPALTYYSLARTKDSSAMYTSVCVMDADTKNQTILTTVPDSTWYWATPPAWSPTGGSIAFLTSGYGGEATWGPRRMPDTIKTIDVSVDALGHVVAKNIRTVYGISGDNGAYLNAPAWSSTAARNQLAFIVESGPMEHVCVIPAGTSNTLSTHVDPIVVRSFPSRGTTELCAWSPDDSKLAVTRDDGASHMTIMIFNTSDWSYIDSLSIPGVIFGLDWSRNGMDKLVFARASNFNSGDYYLYYCDPKTRAVPKTYGVKGCLPSWSPDNSAVVYGDMNNHLCKTTAFGTNGSVVDTNLQTAAWKR